MPSKLMRNKMKLLTICLLDRIRLTEQTDNIDKIAGFVLFSQQGYSIKKKRRLHQTL